jgi:hypothetical protein
MRPFTLLLCLSLAAPALAAQSGVSALVPISPELLLPAEEEPISCRRHAAQDALRVQNQPMGRFAPRTGEAAPVTWSVSTGITGRSLTIVATSGYRPREVSILGQQQNVRVRYFADGSVQDGRRTVTPRGREPGPATPVSSHLDSLDAPQLYELARELVFRCERGILEPVPAGNIQGRIPPR